MRKLWLLPLSAALMVSTVLAQDNSACTLPGERVVEDESNDSGAQPGVGDQAFLDLQTLHMAEPESMPGTLVFTFKVRGLSQLPPGVRWAVLFATPTPPANGGEGWFVMMTTLDDGPNPHFVYGTTGVQPPDAPTGVRLFSVLGNLSSGSGFNADGTITLVLEKAVLGALPAGAFIENVFPIVRTLVTPNGNSFDQAPGTGFYEVIGDEACGESKSGLLGAGALPLTLLLPFGLLALRRRRLS